MIDNGSKVPFEEVKEDFMETEIEPVSKEQAITVALADRLANEFLIILADCSMNGETLSSIQMHKILAGLFRAFGDGVSRGTNLHEITQKKEEKPITLRKLQQSITHSKDDE